MGKFNGTKYIQTIDNLVNSTKDKINNPYYLFSDKKPTKVTYYMQNIEESTLDESSGLYGSHIDNDSPFKFNKINNFLLYGIERIEVNLDVSDFGMESSPIGGDCIILPNTIKPMQGDFFKISYIKEDILFKVNGVTFDTLDTGANIYKIEYQLCKIDNTSKIEDKVVDTYDFIVDNIGTNFKSIIRSKDHELFENVKSLIENLIVKFSNTFFNSKLQTFIYNHRCTLMYDPFLIEFLIRNNVLKFGDEYTYVSHAMYTNKTFSMDYLKTFFYNLENPTKKINCNTVATADLITDPNSLFIMRMENYYWVRHVDDSDYKIRFKIIDIDLLDHIENNKMYDIGSEKEIYNLWISYFNGNYDTIKGDLISMINNTEVMDNKDCFYTLAITIFILEKYVIDMMSAK